MLDVLSKCLLGGGLALAMLVPFDDACAKGLHLLYHFCQLRGCADGSEPAGAVIADKERNFYGTTAAGGSNHRGTVFKLASDGTETVLYSFQGGTDGAGPEAPLVADEKGNLYGTTIGGGDESCASNGCGTVFKLAPEGKEKVLHAFHGFDGREPQAGLIRDKDGNLYGTTYVGGVCGEPYGCGTVFRLAPDGTETVLYAFKGNMDGATDGSYPWGGLITDEKGNLYGTTIKGGGNGLGCDGYGCGTVFKLAPDGTETILYGFSGGNDGDGPQGMLVRDKSGSFYGTTVTDAGGTGYGTVFKLKPNGTQTVLHLFKKQSDGHHPLAGLVADENGNLYGTTIAGGGSGCFGGGVGCGTVFKVSPDGTENVLWSFKNGNRGAQPWCTLWADSVGNLYGTTLAADAEGDSGTVFKLTP